MIEVLLLLVLGVVLIVVIIAANGFFVAQEFAYMSVDRVRLSARADAGDGPSRRALSITRRTSFMLSGAQLGITVTGLLVGYVAEPLVGRSLGVLLGGVGVPAAVSVTIGTVLALSVATIVQMIFGELYPKNLAIANPEPLARALAGPTRVYLVLFGWLISVFDASSNAFLRLLRIEPVHDVDVSATADDLQALVAVSRESGDLPDELSIMLDRILDFPQQDVEHAMIPRARVDVVRPDVTIDEARRLMATAHTRYPVIDDDDAPLGVVHMTDLLDPTLDGVQPVGSIMRPAVIVPAVMSLPDALAELTRSRNQLACVIDEYGGFAGVVTLEDLAEEVVGEITDEHDDEDAPMVWPDGDGVWVMGGDVHLDELERALGHALPETESETVAGLLIEQRGALPARGERLEVALPVDAGDLIERPGLERSIHVTILEIDRHVPSEVRVELVERETEADR